MTDCKHRLDVEAWLDGEAGEQTDTVAKHIAACAPCKAFVEMQRRFDFAARETALTVKAPPSLLSRLDDLDAEAPSHVAPVSRRWTFGAVAASVSALAVGGTLLLRGGSDNEISHAVFGDFATHLDADRKPDLIESDPQRVLAWFAPKLPFSLPPIGALSEVELIGGRLCWLLGRRLAAVNFDRAGAAIGLYVAEAEGLSHNGSALPDGETPALIERNGLAAAFWRKNGLAYALIGQPPAPTISRLTDILRSS
jgi:anti-sigma factor RsiW